MTIRSWFFILCQLVLAVTQLGAQNTSSGIVISQIYGGGGNSGATLRNDFIELFNRSNQSISIAGWSIQYASASGTTWDRTLLSGVIQAGQYYLVQEAQGSGGSSSLPTADGSGSINFSATDGKLALVSNSTLLSGAAPSGTSIVDFVGYGSANAAEGSPAPALSNTTAAIRGSGGCTDSNNNRSDFSTTSPAPRNSHSSVHLCTPTAPPSKPDLVITVLTGPITGIVGGTLTGTSATVTNQGGTAAGVFRLGYYLSTTASMTASSIFTGTLCTANGGLAVGSTFNCNSSVVVPSNLTSGTWYLLAFVDDQNQVDESDESNNVRVSDSGRITLSGGTTSAGPCGVERWG